MEKEFSAEAFIARQPILDRKQTVYAYELLFRRGADNFFQPMDGDKATASLIDDSVHLHSVEKLGSGRKCFINFTRKSLLDGLYRMLPPAMTVVEVLESVELDDALLAACQQARDLGYTLALDDYILEPRFAPLLAMIDILKVEFPVLDDDQHRTVIDSATRYGFQLLAEKVETPEQFEHAMNLGYHYFQGYFFCKPQLQRVRRIPKSQTQSLRLLQKVNETEFSVDAIEEMLRSDLELSYKLLRYLNSAVFHRTRPLSSIRQAIVTLGHQPLRQWVSLLAVQEMSGEKPSELITTCLTRARFCEQIGGQILGRSKAPDCFVTGMFSLLDALLDQSMDELAAQLNLTESVSSALRGINSPLLAFLTLVQAIERADWSAISLQAESLQLEMADVLRTHQASYEWAMESQSL